MMRQGSLFDAIAGRDAGMAQAAEHAEREEPGWADRAFALLGEYAPTRRDGFTTLELRQWALAVHGFKGVTNWAWGSVMTRARRCGLIRQIGSKNVGDSTSHLKLSPLWIGSAP